jgi:hypothetical protein
MFDDTSEAFDFVSVILLSSSLSPQSVYDSTLFSLLASFREGTIAGAVLALPKFSFTFADGFITLVTHFERSCGVIGLLAVFITGVEEAAVLFTGVVEVAMDLGLNADKLLITGAELLTTGADFLIARAGLLITCAELLITGAELLITGAGLLITGADFLITRVCTLGLL